MNGILLTKSKFWQRFTLNKVKIFAEVHLILPKKFGFKLKQKKENLYVK
jgi:hypothetical protein